MRPGLEAHIRHLLQADGLKANDLADPSGLESALESASDIGADAVDRVERHQRVPPHLEDALEAIVLPKLRPVYDIHDDTFNDCSTPWTELNNHRDKLSKAIRSIGRVDASGLDIPYAGTAFLVGKGVLLTNRHVAAIFTDGLGVKGLKFKFGIQPEIDLKQEIDSDDEVLLEIKETLLIHPYWDAALLKVEGFPDDCEPLRLAATAPAELQGRLATIVGYPARDPRNDLDLQKRIFRVFEKKRLQPGRTMAMKQCVSFGNTVDALAHDCSTLGGNSGSALIDVETGQVLGLHFSGEYLKANYAVPAWELALDPKVVDFGVNFEKAPEPKPVPAWLNAWSNA